MSETVDVNVMVYASDLGSTFRDRAVALLGRLSAGPRPVYLLWPVIVGYLRIVTHPAILGAPLDPATAEQNVTGLLARPHVRCVGELDGFWRVYRAVAQDVEPRGNLVSDTHLVALMRQHGVSTMWSHDRDLRKFPDITVRDPFAP